MTTPLLSLLPLLSLAANPAVTSTVEHEPALAGNLLGLEIEAPLSTRGIVDVTSPYVVDASGNEMSSLPGASGMVRTGLEAKTGWFLHPFGLKAGFEADAIGTVTNGPDLRGSGYAYENGWDLQLRKAYVGVGAAYFASIAAGAMTSHWGLGLLANDGDHGWAPGNASFSYQSGGDRVLRAAITSGPWPEYLGVKLAIAGDRVIGDDQMMFGDDVYQALVALSIGEDKPHGAGIYAVRRHADSPFGGRTDVWVVDGTARSELQVAPWLKLHAAAEGAAIFGDTTMAPSTQFPSHDVMQLGGVARIGAEMGAFGLVTDLVYASGDQNLDDGVQNAFQADPNFQQGLLLFRHALAGQTARGVATASDPVLTGKPAQGIERFATRGSVSNAWVFFPRGYFRPISGLEIYGGPLVALSDVPVVDPRNTRLAGGSPRNAVDATPGPLLGAEFDLGVRYRQQLGPVQATLGTEAGVLLPGDALTAGQTLHPIYGTRMLLELRL